MAEARLARLFWEALDHAAYLLTDARLWLFDLMHGPEPPIPADEQREGDRKGPEVLPIGAPHYRFLRVYGQCTRAAAHGMQ